MKIFRLEEDGTLTDMNAVYENGFMVFTTDHFSTYLVVETEPILGDVDGDGEVTIIDATCIQRKLAGLPNSVYFEEREDADGDKELTIVDATFIQRWLAGLPSYDNIGKPL